jgi:hypothetical protein
MHWTKMRGLHQQIKPQLEANHTRILRGPHITALIEDWLAGRRPSCQPASQSTASRPAA